jgi:hypothetical protein
MAAMSSLDSQQSLIEKEKRMWKKALVLSVLVVAVAVLSAPIWSQDKPATTQPAGAAAGVKSFTFDSNDALEGWKIVGDAALDMTKPREAKGGSLKVPAEAKATIKLDSKDGFGQVDMYVFDDGTKTADPKVASAGPRWGIVQSDGSTIAVGVLFATYLAGDEGYTASSSDGQSWFEKLTWLGENRAPAGWHKWTFILDPDKGFTLLHNGKPMADPGHSVSKENTNIKGFNTITIWGDSAAKGQTIWVDDITYTPAAAAAAPKAAETKPAAK